MGRIEPVKQILRKVPAAMAASRSDSLPQQPARGSDWLIAADRSTHVCSTRRRATCVSPGSSPTSSRKMVRLSASSNRPTRRPVAPVNAHFSCRTTPRRHETGIAAQFTLTNACDTAANACGWHERSTPCPFPFHLRRRSVVADFVTETARTLQAAMHDHLLKHRRLSDLFYSVRDSHRGAVFQACDFLERILQCDSRMHLFCDIHRRSEKS